jgi:replicative DNA helicase
MGNMSDSKMLNYVNRKGWLFKQSGDEQIAIEFCPYCSHNNFKLYANISGAEKDGLHDCKVCGVKGNLTSLMKQQGDIVEGLTSFKDSMNNVAINMPPVDKFNKALMEDEDALDYLVHGRGFTLSVIEKYKLGLDITENGEKWISIPYFHKDNLVFVKWRSLPPAEKKFRGIKGREAPLFNQDVIKNEMPELIFVEGEADCLSCLSNGIEAVVGVPGANVQKTTWIKRVDDANISKIYICYDSDSVGQKAAKELAHKIGLDKTFNIVLPSFTTTDGKVGKDINEWFVAGNNLRDFDILKEQSRPFDVEGVINVETALDELDASFMGGSTLQPALDTPWPSLTRRMGGCEWGDLVGIIAEGKIGKEQPLSSKILTPTGWTTMGEIQLGQRITSVDGTPSYITGIYPQGLKEVYQLEFNDGRSCRAGSEHLWKVGSVNNFGRDGYRTVNTLQLIEMIKTDEWFVPLFNGEFKHFEVLPLDSWLLGTLIGDGGLTNSCPMFTNTDDGVLDLFKSKIEDINCIMKVVSEGDISYRVLYPAAVKNPLTVILRNLGLMGKLSINKFIPKQYMQSDKFNRLALLQGLMDTDGEAAGPYGIPIFSTSSLRLAHDVQDLVRSLGGIATMSSRIPSYIGKNPPARAYRVNIKLNGLNPFLASKRAEKFKVPTRNARLTIKGIYKQPYNEHCQCITVSHESHLYVTDDFIVTHNTSLALNWLSYYTYVCNINTLMFCLEMSPKRMVRKWVSHVTHTDDTPGRSQITQASIQEARKLAMDSESEMLFGWLPGATKETTFDLIRQAVRRYGVKVVCFDNLQYLARSITHQTAELGTLSKGFKDLAQELGIVILLIIQPNRVRDGDIVSAKNSNGSSAIEKDVDTMATLHRNRIAQLRQEDLVGIIETEDNFEPMLYGRIDLSRYAPGGSFTLYMEGATSTIREVSDAEKVGMPKINFGSSIQVEA